jgi:predicted DNA-binding helix-hairpin-helix protein
VDAIERLTALTSQMHLEPSEEIGCSHFSGVKPLSGMIHQAAMSGGKPFPLLKTLLTSACERNCNYCPFRAGRNYQRVTMKPEEMAHTFMSLHQKGVVEGMFLSSGIINGGVYTQDQLIETAEILRYRLGFRGYLHLKIMPGVDRQQVLRTMQLADRVSINLEAPNDQRLAQLAPTKIFSSELLQPLKWVDEIRKSTQSNQNISHRWPSSVTQFVVGAAGETDLELLSTTDFLYRTLYLRRIYFSAFSPIENTPFENLLAVAPKREQYLYQASFLLRDYGFLLEDLPFNSKANLPLDIDPKLAWASTNLRESPVELTRASRHELLRIPGIGPKRADIILKYRREGRLCAVEDLHKIGINPFRSAPFVLINGKQLPHQPMLF